MRRFSSQSAVSARRDGTRGGPPPIQTALPGWNRAAPLQLPRRGCTHGRLQRPRMASAVQASTAWSCNECCSPRLTCALPCRARRHLLPCLRRRHGADLCYTEMLFADRFVAEPEYHCALATVLAPLLTPHCHPLTRYRARKLRTCAEDAPLVVQFCGNDPATLAAAARLVRG